MKQALNYSWKFIPDYKDEYLNKLPNSSQSINIPHCAKEIPYNYFDEKNSNSSQHTKRFLMWMKTSIIKLLN